VSQLLFWQKKTINTLNSSYEIVKKKQQKKQEVCKNLKGVLLNLGYLKIQITKLLILLKNGGMKKRRYSKTTKM
jgi:hypothetical protein